jgi:hypothetical protein
MGETGVQDDASVSSSEKDVNSDEAVDEGDVSDSWVIMEMEGERSKYEISIAGRYR